MSEHHSTECMNWGGRCICAHSDNKTKYDFEKEHWKVMKDPTSNPPSHREKVKYSETAEMIREECDSLAAMLIQKNEAYGDSAISPKRIFSRADSVEQIKVRIDDKLSRMANTKDGQDAMGEDIEKDLLGYLILLRVARRKQWRSTAGAEKCPVCKRPRPECDCGNACHGQPSEGYTSQGRGDPVG